MRISLEAAAPMEKPVQAAPAQGATSPFKDAMEQAAGQKSVPPPSTKEASPQQKTNGKATDKKADKDDANATGVATGAAVAQAVPPPVVTPVPALTTDSSVSPDRVASDTAPAVFRLSGAGASGNSQDVRDVNEGSDTQDLDAPGLVGSGSIASSNDGQNKNVLATLPFDKPVPELQATPGAAATDIAKKMPASPGKSEQAATPLPEATANQMPTEMANQAMASSAQTFSGIEGPAATSNVKQSHAPVTKIANSSAAKDSTAIKKESAVSSPSSSSDAAAGGVARSNAGGSGDSSSGGGGDFQRAVKTAVNDPVQNAAPLVSAIGGEAAAGANAGGQPAVQQPAPTQADAQPGQDAGGLASTATSSTASMAAGAAAATPGLSSAQLVQSMRGSEMRIGMHSEEFGAISINTSLSHQSLAAQISFDHAELGKALAVHVPEMQEKLGSAYGVQTRVEVRDGQATFGGEGGQQGGENMRGQGNTPTHVAAASPVALANAAELVAPQVVAYANNTRLDIRI